MKKLLLTCGALSLIAGVPLAQAAVSTYNVTTTWFEPDTQPYDSIFIGSFGFDSVSHMVSNLKGTLTESMSPPMSVELNNQLVSWHDAGLGGTFAATFKNTTTATFVGGTWRPEDGVLAGGFPPNSNPENAYALIFVPDILVPNMPTTSLTQAQLDKVAYADCTPGGMMGNCMTGTSVAGYGAVGTMSGYPVSQVITLAPVPEPESYAMLLAGLGLLGFIARRRRQAVP